MDELPALNRSLWNLSMLYGLGGFTLVARDGDQALLLAPPPAAE
jgi:hypothetical protein